MRAYSEQYYLTPSFGFKDLFKLFKYIKTHSLNIIKIKKILKDIKKSTLIESLGFSSWTPLHWVFLKQKAPTY